MFFSRLSSLPLLALLLIASSCDAWMFSPNPQVKLPQTSIVSPRSVEQSKKGHSKRLFGPSDSTEGISQPFRSFKSNGSISKILRRSGDGGKGTRPWLRVGCLAALFIAMTLVGSPQKALASTLAQVPAEAVVEPIAAAASVAAAAAPAAATAAAATPVILSLPSPMSLKVEMQLTGRLCMAALLGGAVGKERSSTHKHSAGVRTMALVALGASAFTVCSSFGFLCLGAGRVDPSRMASNVASGVGFVGAGVITTSSVNPQDSRQSIVHGLTTATAIWISAAIGVACGVGMMYTSALATVLTVTILRFGRVKTKVRNGATQAQAWVKSNWQFQPSPQQTQQLSSSEASVVEQPVSAATTEATNTVVVAPPLESTVATIPSPVGVTQQSEAAVVTTATATNTVLMADPLEATVATIPLSEPAPLIKSTNMTLEEMTTMCEEEEEADWDEHVEEWDSHVEVMEQEDRQDEEEPVQQEEEVEMDPSSSPSQPVLTEYEDLLNSDRDVAEFHQFGQASILGVAHAASFGRNVTTGFDLISKQKNLSFHDSTTSEDDLRYLERGSSSESDNRSKVTVGHNETLAP